MLSRSCRPSGHAVSRKRSGWSLAPSSQSAQRRLIPTRRRGGAPVRSRCHRSARALGTWLACHWWRRDGKALEGRGGGCCCEAAARLAPRFRERSRVELRSLVSVRSVRDATNRDPAFEADARLAMALPLSEQLRRSDSDTTHLDSSTRWLRGAVAVSSLRPSPWDLVGLSLVAA